MPGAKLRSTCFCTLIEGFPDFFNRLSSHQATNYSDNWVYWEVAFVIPWMKTKFSISTVADPGFPVGGGVDLVGGRGLPRWLRFEHFVCQNERIGTLRGACAGHAPSSSANAVNARSIFLFGIHPWNHIRHFPVSETQWKFEQFGSPSNGIRKYLESVQYVYGYSYFYCRLCLQKRRISNCGVNLKILF